MNSLRFIFTSALLLAAGAQACMAQTNPANQINWPGVNAQTGTSYSIVAGDIQKLVTFSNASAVAVSLPQATGSFGRGAALHVANLGAGTVTITPTTSTINGASTLVLTQNQGAFIVSDGTNYASQVTGAAGSMVISINGASGAFTFNGPGASCSTTTCTFQTGFLPCSDTSGSGTAQSCTTSPSFTVATNSCVVYTTTTANTGTGLTLNVNSSGAKSVAKWQSTTTLASGDVPASKPVLACYDGTHWNLATIGNAPSGGGSGTVNSGSGYALPAYGASSGTALSPTTGLATDASGNDLLAQGYGAFGSTPPLAICGSGTVPGCLGLSESSTALVPTANQCGIKADSVTHSLYWSCNGVAAAPLPTTASQINTLLQGLSGCNTATYVYSPQSGSCVAPGGGGGGGFTPFPSSQAAPLSTNFTQANFTGGAVADKTARMVFTGASSSTGLITLLSNTSLPSPPYTIDMAFSQEGIYTGSGGAGAGLMLRNSTSGNIVLMNGRVANSSSNPIQLCGSVDRWASYTSYGTTPITAFEPSSPNYTAMRITDDGTNRKFYCSTNGQDFSLVGSESDAAYITPNQVGISIFTNSSSNAVVMSIVNFVVTNSVLPAIGN